MRRHYTRLLPHGDSVLVAQATPYAGDGGTNTTPNTVVMSFSKKIIAEGLRHRIQMWGGVRGFRHIQSPTMGERIQIE